MPIDKPALRDSLSAIRERIADAKRRGTRGGFIDYYGCMKVCNELMKILEEAEIAVQRGDPVFAYSITALIHWNAAKLAGTADDSAGGIMDTMRYVKVVLDQTCASPAGDPEAAEFIFLSALKDSLRKEYDGWDEFVYDLLLPVARLATKENVRELYAVLDGLNAKLIAKEYSSWHLESDCLVRLAAIMAVEGEEEADRFIAKNVEFDSIRRIAIQKALEKHLYIEAEKLCRDKIRLIDRGDYRGQEWNDMIFDIYVASGNRKQQEELARTLLIVKKDTGYYEILKNLLVENETWEEEFPALLDQLAQSLPYHSYMLILVKEGENKRLLAELRNHPSEVFRHMKQLAEVFPKETYAICVSEIEKLAAEANTRAMYRQICAHIRALRLAGGQDEAGLLASQFMKQYKGRPAMVQEMQKLEKSFIKRGK